MRPAIRATASAHGLLSVSEMPEKTVAKTRLTCRSCLEPIMDPVISFGDQYLVNFVPQPDLTMPRAPLDLVRCRSCGLLQLRHTTEPDLLYRQFWYRSAVNETMRAALRDVVSAAHAAGAPGAWLDIGANDGYLLSQVPASYEKIACEPARNFHDELARIADHVMPDYFSAHEERLTDARGEGRCGVITSCAMFYDLDDPNSFVRDIAASLATDGVWVNQLNDAPTIVANNAWDGICHEHLCYYDLASLDTLYRAHGLAIVNVTYNDVNGGSMRVFARHESVARHRAAISEHKVVAEREAHEFASRAMSWRMRMRDIVEGAVSKYGPQWCYGASTKGAMLLQYLDCPGAFHAIADRNPAKFGLYMAGAWLPIHPEDDMRNERPAYALVLPWAFRKEFVAREKDLRLNGTAMLFPLPNIEVVL